MAKYMISLSSPLGLDHMESVYRHRVDAVRYWVHKYVYDAFEARGLRDSRAAHIALKTVYTTDFRNLPVAECGRRMFKLDCGEGYVITVNAGAPAQRGLRRI